MKRLSQQFVRNTQLGLPAMRLDRGKPICDTLFFFESELWRNRYIVEVFFLVRHGLSSIVVHPPMLHRGQVAASRHPKTKPAITKVDPVYNSKLKMQADPRHPTQRHRVGWGGFIGAYRPAPASHFGDETPLFARASFVRS